MDSSKNQCHKEKNKKILYKIKCNAWMLVGSHFKKNPKFWIDWIVVKCRICNLVLYGSKITIDILENKYYL